MFAQLFHERPEVFSATDHWLRINEDNGYVGIYFILQGAGVKAKCHVTLHLNGHRVRVTGTNKTETSLHRIVDKTMANLTEVSTARPVFWSLTEPIALDTLKQGIVHRVIVTIHVGSWAHERLHQCRNLATNVHGIKQHVRVNFHVSCDRVL